MMRKIIFFMVMIAVLVGGGFVILKKIDRYKNDSVNKNSAESQAAIINQVLNSRRLSDVSTSTADPFGADGVVRVLFIGLDKRAGQVAGHCDAIQLLTIDKNSSTFNITAVPRGTYSPLPPGKGTTSSDFYVSNSCALGGLDYGINQIEKILGVKTDYLVVVGFSEVLGILRSVKLPTTETLQWLRQRHGYAIGEPQRAHNHSMFIKQMIVKYIPERQNAVNTAFQYMIYKMIETNLTFDEIQAIVQFLEKIEVSKHPEKIVLNMRPAYNVEDVIYSPGDIDNYLAKMLNPVKKQLTMDDYSGVKVQTVQEKLLKTINEKKNDPEFIRWSYENNLWLQIEDRDMRLGTQFDFLVKYLKSVTSTPKREQIIADYVLEMENYNEKNWQEKGRELLTAELPNLSSPK